MLRFPTHRAHTSDEARRLRLVTSTPPSTAPELISARAMAFIVGCALLFGILVRVSFVTAFDFPLNDGGLFYTMSLDLQSNGYRLPEFTSYNFDQIPFAYPPLSLYAAALLDDATPLSAFDVFRLLPLCASIATMFAFLALARRMLPDRVSFAAAVAAFALIPRSYEWMIMGGGITRSFGMLFALLALHEAHRLFVDQRRTAAVTLGLLGGLALLSHLEIAWFIAFSVMLFVAANGRHRTGVVGLLVAGMIAIAVAAPWWITVIAYHGISPFVAAASTASPSHVNPIAVLIVFQVTAEPMFALITALALLGVARCMADRRWLLPIWLLACGLLDSRGFENVAAIPVAMLAGLAVGRVLLPLLLQPEAESEGARRWIMPSAVFGFLGLYALLNALIATPQLLDATSHDERDAMRWVATNTPVDSQFLVISDQLWAVDRASEWFSVLADRRSVATVQGYEWLPDFGERFDSYAEIQKCAERSASCVDAWAEGGGASFDYIYMPKVAELQRGTIDDPHECCAALRLSLRADDRYEVVFDGLGATVFARAK